MFRPARRLTSDRPCRRRCCPATCSSPGSIGRTDLPGGDHAAMMRSLATKVLTLPDEVVVLPGHGPQTTIGRERATNPYLRELPPPARRGHRPGGS